MYIFSSAQYVGCVCIIVNGSIYCYNSSFNIATFILHFVNEDLFRDLFRDKNVNACIKTCECECECECVLKSAGMHTRHAVCPFLNYDHICIKHPFTSFYYNY